MYVSSIMHAIYTESLPQCQGVIYAEMGGAAMRKKNVIRTN